MNIHLINAYKLLRDTLNTWLNQHAASKGAALAFYTLFAMAPLLILVIGIAGYFFGNQTAQNEILIQINSLVGPLGAQAVNNILSSAHNSNHGFLANVIATTLLLIGATSIFSELKTSLDEIWQVPPSQKSGLIEFINTRLLSFGVILVLAFLLLVSLIISAALAMLEKFWGNIWQQFLVLLKPMSFLFSFAVITALFATIFKLLPSIKVGWLDVAIGALGTAVLFLVGKTLIGIYLGSSGVISSYGAGGSIVALLLWVYYSAQIVFLGASFTKQYAFQFGSLKH